MEAWIWLNEWTHDGLEILGVFLSEEAAIVAHDECEDLPRRVNSQILGPYPVRE